MHITHAFRALALSALVWAGPVQAAPAPGEAEKFLGRILSVKAQIADINAERNRATATMNSQLTATADSLSLLTRLPLDEEKVERMQFNLAEAKARVASLEQQLEVAKITDPAAQASKKNELEQTQNRLRDELKAAAIPFEQRIKDAQKPVEALADDWAAALGGYFKTPATGPYAGLTKSEIRWSKFNTGQLSWTDATGKQVAWISIFLEETPADPASRQKKLDGKYPMSMSNVSNIWVNCGHLKLSLHINKLEWQTGEATTVEIFKTLVDVEGLTKLKPAP